MEDTFDVSWDVILQFSLNVSLTLRENVSSLFQEIWSWGIKQGSGRNLCCLYFKESGLNYVIGILGLY